jgi:hypothetical protein
VADAVVRGIKVPLCTVNKVSGKLSVSVVIILLNAERFIEEGIESVFTQTYDNWRHKRIREGCSELAQRHGRRE